MAAVPSQPDEPFSQTEEAHLLVNRSRLEAPTITDDGIFEIKVVSASPAPLLVFPLSSVRPLGTSYASLAKSVTELETRVNKLNTRADEPLRFFFHSLDFSTFPPKKKEEEERKEEEKKKKRGKVGK